MSTCVEKIPHICGSSNALQVFEEDGVYTGFCFACGKYEENPYKDKDEGYKPTFLKKSSADVQKELYEISKYPYLPLVDRFLTAETLKYFRVKVGVSQLDGETPEVIYRPYTGNSEFRAYKAKILANKKMWSIGNQRDVDPFGYEQAITSGSLKLFITEGEEDAMALYQVLRDSNQGSQYSEQVPAVISLPHGSSGAVKDLLPVAHTLSRLFKEIILVFDMDEPGQAAAIEVVKSVFPSATIAILPSKDANAALIEGRSKALVSAVMWNSIPPKNSSLKGVEELMEKAKKPPEFGYSYPWKGLTDLTRGLRTGEVVYIPAAVKAGKSTLVNQVAVHLMVEEGINILCVKPEEASHKTLQMLAGVVADKIFHDPAIKFGIDVFEKAALQLKGKLTVLDSYQLLDWDKIKNDIVYAIVNNNVKAVFIDPLTALTSSMSSAEANEFLGRFCPEVAKMAIDYDVAFVIPVHLKASDSKIGHEEGAKILLKEIVGSRAMIRSAHLIVALEKLPDVSTKEEANVRILRVLADRNLGVTGGVKLYYNSSSGKLEQFEVFE